MLCKPCSEHFSPSLLPVEKCLELKLKALEKLRNILREPEMSKFELNICSFENEVTAYREAIYRYGQSNPPCPWSRQDLSWLPSALEICVHIDVWDRERERERSISSILEEESSRQCELCKRLGVAITMLGDIKEDFSSATLESWLCVHSISMVPLYLKFFVRAGNVSSWFNVWITFEPGKANSTSARWDLAYAIIQDTLPFLGLSAISTKDSICFKFLSDGLNRCLASHVPCREERPAKWVPTRLIDVQPNVQNHDAVKLVEREGLLNSKSDGSIQYFTLSHKWGQESFVTLTESNKEKMKVNISMETLPPCFKDAVFTTRQLGYRYIWIDSLWYDSLY